ncbi:hypothetical protein [Microvirga roseola]|uniref:hypothetical protein n=1 Tax=Microvirga roseola TaxID=2883126 RepID=UPI001E6352E0|nr:hypothetical protein [Microvirga roseola]
MFEASPNSTVHGQVAILFHPGIVPVMDVFRSLDSLDEQYDLTLLDGPERALAPYARPETAKAIISDALLLAFALTRERGKPFDHRPLGSRQGTMDEYSLVALIGSSRGPITELTVEAAAALDIISLDFIASLAGELVRQIDLSDLTFDPPSPSEFKTIVRSAGPVGDPVRSLSGATSFSFKF